MKQVWLHLTSWNKGLVTESIENGIDVILTSDEFVDKIKELGRIAVASPEKGDLLIPRDVEIVVISSKDEELKAAQALSHRIVAVRTTDWDIIPIENLIPRGGNNLFTFVRNLEEAKLAAGIMEKGVAGLVIETDDPSQIREVVQYVHRMNSEKVPLEVLEVVKVVQIGIGDRVCVDTCSNLNLGEGLLVGNSSQGLFLVHAENIENPYVAPRPFRINAGAVHSYARVPGDRTRYLGELKTGDPVLIVSSNGTTCNAYVGRSKIEKRPLLVVYAADTTGREISVVLQNAETIRLTTPDGNALSVAKLKKGDRVLGYTEKGGRHFGMAVEESIQEQ
ncbi:MAG TPA: 3-dehydroquinate synthase II [Spirochaetota bacterium]|nr:3-dehydroquinate synthase II [Spirochaetota bacterium]HPI88285.1 3-dehydroquinate synthase II [Spirochaetota bacterium]HPR47749.1 3-dehydroquinate synthase II [Spirochaetota bacterium]